MNITLQQAQAITAAAIAKSEELGGKLDVAVVDAGANLFSFIRINA